MNWERLPGETVQELVAALILLGNPQGNPITPSRGDRGIDVRIRTPDGFAVYQVKKYAKPLTAKQAKDVEHSWQTFMEEGRPTLADAVASWTLVMPWDPTVERLEWLDDLTSGCGFAINWMGRNHLDVLAAARSDVVDYYLGDGADRVVALMAQAIGSAKDVTDGEAGEALVDSAKDRTLRLASSLDAVDPFYRYFVDVRPGPLPETFGAEMEADASAAFVTYEQIDEQTHLVMRVLPRSPWSMWLRPIQRTVGFEVGTGTADAVAVEKFLRYGAPLDRVPFTTISAEGPPGTTGGQSGFVSVVPIGHAAAADFEIRFLNADEDPAVIPLLRPTASTGPVGDGYRWEATDPSGVLTLEVLAADSSPEMTVNLSTTGWDGKPVGRVRELAYALGQIRQGTRIEIAVRGAPAFAQGIWGQQAPPLTRGVVEWIEALVTIQRHSQKPIAVPPEASDAEITSVRRALALLAGQVLQVSDELRFEAGPETVLPGEERAFLVHTPLAVVLGGQVFELDRKEVIYSERARLTLDAESRLVQVVGLAPVTVRAVSPDWQPPGTGTPWRAIRDARSSEPEAS